jgi:hypothetical protein
LSLQIVSWCLEEGVNPTNVCSHFFICQIEICIVLS